MNLLTNLLLALSYLAASELNVDCSSAPAVESAAGQDGPASSAAPRMKSSAPEPKVERRVPWYVILNVPQDLGELWRKIEHPDLVLLEGDRGKEAGADGMAASEKGTKPATALVESVKITARVVAETASLELELGVLVKADGDVWVPIRLDNQRLVAARESGRDLDLRQDERRGWQVRLSGRGEHHIGLTARAGINNELARRRLSLSIPEAAATRLELDLGGRGSDIVIGSNEDFGQNDRGRDRAKPVTAHLSPRSKLDVSWLDEADSKGEGSTPPFLTAQGEIAIEVDAQAVRTRSTWSIRCVRGAATSLQMKVADDEEITELELRGQSLAEKIGQWRGPGKLTVPLIEPLRAGSAARLVLRTRRSLAKSGQRRFSFTGFSFSNVREQTGYLGITNSPNIWVGSTAAEGLHRIDASKLPSDLRARPATSLAYEFLDQPFELDLAVEAAPVQIRGETRAVLEVEPDRVRSETTIDLTWLGEVFELEVAFAPGLEVESVGPRELLESWHVSDSSQEAPGAGANETREPRLNIRLSSQARDARKVTLKLGAVQAIEATGAIKLGLFFLDRTIPVNAFYAVGAARGLALEAGDLGAGRLASAADFKSRFQNLPASWPAMFLPREELARQLFLSGRGDSSYLPIKVTRPKRLLRQETTLSAKVSSRSVEVIERAAISVRHGELKSVVIRVPASFAARWELLERQEIDSQELGRDSDGSWRYRLTFDRPAVDQVVVRFRYRVPVAKQLEAETPRDVAIEWIKIEEGEAAPVRVELELDPEIVFESGTPAGWVRAADSVRAEPAGERSRMQFIEQKTQGNSSVFSFSGRALAQLALPSTVIPRMLVKTVQGIDGSRRTTARYWVELHGAQFDFELPSGAVWVEARVNGRIADQVDYDRSSARHSLRLKGDSASKPVLIDVEFVEPAAKPGAGWRLPKLAREAVILQVLWEARVPWSVAVVGIPRGWSDENHWSFSGLSWKRRPLQDSSSLNAWLSGSGPAAAGVDDFVGSGAYEEDRYLFSSRGEPPPMQLWLVPGSWLVGVCSGTSLVIGFLAIFRKVRFRTIWLGIASATVLAAALVEPVVTALVLQAAALGALLSLLGFVIERAIERARLRLSPFRRRSPAAARPVSESPPKGTAVVGSDDPTAIRVRVPSTVDHAPAADVAGQEVLQLGSSIERA